MATVILVRHGRSTANTAGVLAGRTPGVLLDDKGLDQAGRTAERLAAVPLARIVTSPLERTRQTADAILAHQDIPTSTASADNTATEITVEDGITECDYGDWQNRKLSELAKEPLWKTVLGEPSAAVFPGGESLPAMQARAVEAIRRHDTEVTETHGTHAVWAAVSHGDIIKSLIADAYGMPLDNFQRIHADPASVTVIHYGSSGSEGPNSTQVFTVNSSAGDLSWLRPAASSDSTDVPTDDRIGGGAGH